MTISNSVSSVPLDGSSAVVVPFLTPFAQVCSGVTVQYTPASETDYQINTQVINVTTTGFTLIATGGPVGTTGPFTYIAQGT